MSECTYVSNSQEPCAECPRAITALYYCKFLQDGMPRRKFRLPEFDGFKNDCNICEAGISSSTEAYVTKQIFKEPLQVKAGQHIEIFSDGSIWLCQGSEYIKCVETLDDVY